MRTFWLSFADDLRPKGQQHLGVAVIDVSDAEAEIALAEVRIRFPRAQPGAEWIAAATRKAWLYGCNPGGQILAAELAPETAAGLPRNRLLTKAQVHQYGERLSGHSTRSH